MVDHHDEVVRQHGYHLLPVKKIIQETNDTLSFAIDVPDELRDIFQYRAGQFCTFRVRIGDDEHIRCYSMSSSPETDSDLVVTVKRVPGGLISNWFHDRVAEGDLLDVAKPTGVFCVHDGERPVVAFCGGSGVTPVISIAKTVLTTTQRPVKILYANRDRQSVIFDDELRQMHEQHADRFELRHHVDSDAGFLQPGDIAGFVGDTLDADFYICGPGPFMDLVEAALHAAGVNANRISIERFGGGPAAPAVAPDAGGAEVEVPESILLIVKRKKHTLTYRAGDTVLDTARRGGVQTPFSCEAGNCAACMALVRVGSVTMRANAALTPDEVEQGWVLTCQSIPTSSKVTIEFEPL